MPVYNSQETIVETVNSVISQSYTNWELVCVDDGSSDESISIINSLALTESRIRFLCRNRLPKGGSTCRNIGAQNANGEYLVFLDSDDLLAPTCLKERIEIIQETNNKFVVFPMASFPDGDFGKLKQPHNIRVVDYDYLFSAAISAWPITSTIIERDFFLSLGGFNESFPRLQDIEFHLRAITQSYGHHKVEFNHEADCFYRLCPGGYNVQKLRNSFVSYRLFISLLLSILESGKLNNKKKISRSFVLLFSNISIIKYSLWKEGEDIKEWSSILDNRVKKYVNKITWLFITFLNRRYNSIIFAKLHFITGRCLLHFSMNSFEINS